jgi:hypothetical protein
VHVAGDEEQLADQASKRAGVQLLELPGHGRLLSGSRPVSTRGAVLGGSLGRADPPVTNYGPSMTQLRDAPLTTCSPPQAPYRVSW